MYWLQYSTAGLFVCTPRSLRQAYTLESKSLIWQTTAMQGRSKKASDTMLDWVASTVVRSEQHHSQSANATVGLCWSGDGYVIVRRLSIKSFSGGREYTRCRFLGRLTISQAHFATKAAKVPFETVYREQSLYAAKSFDLFHCRRGRHGGTGVGVKSKQIKWF